MADKSVLSLKGEIQWASGNYQGVINDTKRMVMQHNQAISGEIKNGRRERERDFKRSLDNIEEIEKQSADSLVKNKQNVAQRLTATRLEQRTAPKLADDATSEMKKRAKGVDDLLGGGVKPEATYEIYGEFGSGKTQFCNSLTVETIHNGENVIWIDCEDTFKP